MEAGTARGQWARPAPALCHLHPSSVPLHTNSNTHTPSLSQLAYLSRTLARRFPPFAPTSYVHVCLSLSQSLFLFLPLIHTHTHTLACHSSSSPHCEDDCLWTDIHDTGRMSWINCVCVGIDPINTHNRNQCVAIIIQEEEIHTLVCHELSTAASW